VFVVGLTRSACDGIGTRQGSAIHVDGPSSRSTSRNSETKPSEPSVKIPRGVDSRGQAKDAEWSNGGATLMKLVLFAGDGWLGIPLVRV
jgi:hypothetical protein